MEEDGMRLLWSDGSALLWSDGSALLWADAADSGCPGSVGVMV